MNDHIGNIKTTNSDLSGTEVPFAMFLTKQGARFTAKSVIKQADAGERVATCYFVHPQRPGNSVKAELDRLGAHIGQRNYCPVKSGFIPQPSWTWPTPYW